MKKNWLYRYMAERRSGVERRKGKENVVGKHFVIDGEASHDRRKQTRRNQGEVQAVRSWVE